MFPRRLVWVGLRIRAPRLRQLEETRRSYCAEHQATDANDCRLQASVVVVKLLRPDAPRSSAATEVTSKGLPPILSSIVVNFDWSITRATPTPLSQLLKRIMLTVKPVIAEPSHTASYVTINKSHLFYLSLKVW